MEQSEQDVRDIERAHELPPDEPHPRRENVYAEARRCLEDAVAALGDPDPEDALRAIEEATARIKAAM